VGRGVKKRGRGEDRGAGKKEKECEERREESGNKLVLNTMKTTKEADIDWGMHGGEGKVQFLLPGKKWVSLLRTPQLG